MVLVIIIAEGHNDDDNTVDKAFYLGDGQVIIHNRFYIIMLV